MKQIPVHRIVLLLLVLYIIMAPFYLWRSGLPQIGDFIVASLLVVFLFKYNFTKDSILYISILLIFYVLIINGVFSMIHSTLSMNINTLYYIFNIAVLLVFINLYRLIGDNLISYLKYGIIISVVLQFIMSFPTMGTGTRQMIFFNNPNQLGYFALITLAFLTLIMFIGGIKFRFYIILISMSMYLVLISLSSASLIAGIIIIVVTLLYLLFQSSINYKHKIIITPAFSGLFVFSGSIQDNDLYKKIENRFISKEVNLDTNISERRIDIVIDNKEYWLFGAGQGLMSRFGSNLEIHSSFPAFFFYYGVVGLSLLSALFIKLINWPTFITFVILIAVHFYGLTHQGLREPMLWILIGFIYLINKHRLINIQNIRF